jgi:hypothetical protein
VGFRIYITEDRLVALLILLAFLITFALTRLYTRLARQRGWGSGHAGDIHVHHVVIGMIFVLFTGWAALALDPGHPWIEILAVFFGIGAALTLDEFAMVLHMKDVYWAQEGRSSVDAVILAALLGSIVVLGMTPVGIDESAGADIVAVSVCVAVVASAVSIMKGKLYMGILGLFVPPVGYVAAIRLARPRSPWARWRYKDNEAKMAKAIARDVKREARKTRVRDVLGGSPSLKSPEAKPPEAGGPGSALAASELPEQHAGGQELGPDGHPAGAVEAGDAMARK